MPDADRLDRLLAEAGERWRAGQPRPPALGTVWKAAAPRSGLRPWSLLAAAGLVTVIAAALVGAGAKPEPAPSNLAVVPSVGPTVPGSCPVTLHVDAGPIASETANLSLPGYLAAYGVAHLWTLVPQSGSWQSGPSATGGRFIRTFWYSDRWSVASEPEPSISVSAGRLGGGESVTGGPAVNARSHELGTSMIVSLDLPTGGCWQITGTYREASLSYVVWVDGPLPAPSTPSSDGLPAEIDGQPVLVGDVARAALAASTDATPLLIGGWLPAAWIRSCPMVLQPDPWNPCAALWLLDRPVGGATSTSLFGADGRVSLPLVPEGMVEPLVFRVHTHDPACVGRQPDCLSRPVIDALVWSGPIGPVPSPTSTQPPNGLSQAEAERIAVAAARGRAVGEPIVMSARLGRYAEVGPAGSTDVAGDRWVWAVVVRAFFVAPDCATGVPCPDTGSASLIVLDDITGAVLIQETPAPSVAGPTMSATDLLVNAQTIAAKFEEARAAGYWDLAWGFLSPLTRRQIGSEQAFIAGETAYNAAGGTTGQIAEVVPLGLFDAADSSFFAADTVADITATVAPDRAFVVTILHPGVDGASAGSRTYVVGSLSDTEWEIWSVH